MSKANWANPENQEVANEAWFSSKPKHDDTSELVDKVNRKISAIKELVRDGKLLADYRDMVKKISAVKLPADKAKALALSLANKHYEENVEKIPVSNFSTPEQLFSVIFVTQHPCQEDYNQGYVCLEHLQKSSAYRSDPVLTAIFSQCEVFESRMQLLLDNGKHAEAILNKALAVVNDEQALADVYKSYDKSLKFDQWSYCAYGEPLEKYDGLRLVESLAKSVPMELLTRLSKKAEELITAHKGKNKSIVKGFIGILAGNLDCIRTFYTSMEYHIKESNKVFQRLNNTAATEGFGDFYSETMNINDFALQYDQEHQLDTPYRMVKVDAKGNITQHKVLLEKGIGNMYEQIDDVPMLDFVALESEGGEGKSLIARLIEKIKQFFIWLAKKVGIYREQEEKVDLGDIKKKHDDIEDQVRKCQSEVVDVKDFKESLRSEAIAKLRMSTQDQKLACYLLDTHYKQANKDTLASIFNTARIWNINPVAAAGLAIIGPYQTVKHYPAISEAIKSLEVIIDSLVKAADTVASNGNGANITALSRLPKVDIDALQSLRQSLSKVYSLENIKDADSDIIKDKDAEQVFSDISNFDKLINKFDGAVEHVTVTLNKLNGNAVKNNDIELEEIGKWLNYTATLVANMISIFNGYRQVFQHQWSWLRRYEQLLIVKYKPAAEGWAGVANQEVQDEDLGMNELLDMESDTEDFDIEMDNETLGVDDLEDYVSNDVEPAQTEVAVGLEHYGELIASKGMCKEYYVACESLQPGIFSGIQQNRLTALPSRTMQAVALEAVEGEQKKGLIARLIEKIKQFFKWVLSKLGIGVGTVKGKDANGKEVEVEYDSTVHAEVMDEAVAEIIRQAEDLKEKHEEIKPSKSSHFDTLHVSTPAQRLARDILSKHYKSTGAALIVKKINQCPAWNKYPVEVAGVLLTGSCYIVKDNEYIDRGIASIEEHMALIMKVSSMIKDGTIDKWDSSEALDVNRIDNQNIYKDSLESILVINEVNLNKFTGGVLENRNITKIGKAIEKYTTYSKELKEKVAHAKEAFDHISNSPEAATDIVLNSLSSLFAFTMQSINNVNGIVRQHTHALLMQERWIRRLIKLVKKTKATPATESFIGWAQPAPVPQSWCIPAMEAIDFQYKSKLFTRLTKWCAELRMAKNFTSKALAESDIGKIIEEETNLQFIFKIDPEQDANAAVLTVQLDRNNPIYTNFLHNFLDNDELLRAKSLLGNTIEGLIDYQKGKVGGVFAKVKNTMWLTVGLVKSKLLTDEEVAAVICHEIGHTFTIFSQIASIVSLNYIIDDLSKRVLGTNDRKVQISILHEYDTKYGIKLPEDEILATTDNKQKFVTKVVTDVVKRSRNVEGDYVFSMRNCELAADQFAARMGAGRHIVSGLNKMYATWGHMQYQSKGVHYTIQAFTVLATALLSTAGIILNPLLPILIIFGLVMDRPQEKVYDEPMQRFTRIRNEYIAALKQVGLSREMKSVYLDDIQAMDKIISAMNKNIGWLEWVWVNWIPSGKRTAKAEAYQQLIERMGNNDLFMKSASYELLIEDLKNA